MKDIEDAELKAEMDEIMHGVEDIMAKVEELIPRQSAPPAEPIES